MKTAKPLVTKVVVVFCRVAADVMLKQDFAAALSLVDVFEDREKALIAVICD